MNVCDMCHLNEAAQRIEGYDVCEGCLEILHGEGDDDDDDDDDDD